MGRTGPGKGIALFALAFLALLGLSSVVVVDEGHQAVIERMGEPDRVVNRFRPDGPHGTGVVFKLPLVEQVTLFERGLIGYSLGGQQIRTADAQVLLVDADLTYRIIDPVRLLAVPGEGDKAESQLRAVLPSLLEEELGQHSAQSIALPGSGGASRKLLSRIDAKARSFGVQVVDFRIGRIGLTEAGLKQTYDRMQEYHEREAYAIELGSAEEAKAILAQAQGEAATIMQQSAGQDPEFYAYFRALRSYETMLADPRRRNAATIVIPPGSAYLKYLNGQ
ncbi:SPFH domain-containing protein [Novosphingobium sp.]|uniref:SPFH domain-containing protein n=1 Tax=Novosphingobium sp. TaxID=1874826 RepID=UPI0025CF3C0C|nr:SPFH domain-containing protein [Novosphingobium sp.]MCC6926527.1 hypothetical protein [Novosphingobium sp.]